MTESKTHDLHHFMRQISNEMAAEYERISMRTTEDPGTAGDQGEENWAELLREWLPRNFEVVTKGRIIGTNSDTSPQVDVLVLKGSYPRKLLDKKLYLAAGVAAVFECKTTLKAAHLTAAAETCARVKKLYPSRTGSPYQELHSPVVYGVLAHSHSWKGENSAPEENVERSLLAADRTHANHPREQLDLVCVADLATWVLHHVAFIGPHQVRDWSEMEKIYGPSGSAMSSYVGHTRDADRQIEEFTPIGTLVSALSQKLAWEEPSLRSLADYYRLTNIAGAGGGDRRNWPSSIYSEEIRARVEASQLSSGKAWDEWHVVFS